MGGVNLKRGISFEIPNEYGCLLGDALQPIDVKIYNWKIGDGESYKFLNGRLEEALFPEDQPILEGSELENLIEANEYYVIFANLQAFPKGNISNIETYEGFTESDCELAVLIVDCIYATIYCKNQDTIELLHRNALVKGFKDIEYITDENDSRTRLSVW